MPQAYCRCWAPLFPGSDGAQQVLATVQDTLDYSALAVFTHAQDSIPFNSLGSLVADQLALRVEHMTKDFIIGERTRLGNSMPSWRLTLNQTLKQKLLRSAADEALVASLHCTNRPSADAYTHGVSMGAQSVSLPAPPASSFSFQSGAPPPVHSVSDLSAAHLERLRPHIGDHSIVGYLLRLPYSETLLVPAQQGSLSDVEKALRETGLASLDYPEMKYAQAAIVEHYKLPFVCCVWLYVVAIYKD